jgi:glycosyltransferase involved in cell wall biosynthesis
MANQNPNLYYDIEIAQPIWQRIREQVLLKALMLSQSLSEITIFMSESSRRRAAHRMGISEHNTQVIYHGVDPNFGDMPAEDSDIQIEERDYILLVSTVVEHKNIHNLVKAYSRLSSETRYNHPLIIVGDKKSNQKYTKKVQSLIKELGVTRDISLIGRVDLDVLKSYYDGAHLFVFPSLIESFGLPLLEAMAFNIPIVASARAALPEVGGEAAIYFDPGDPDQMSVIIEKALDDQDLRKKLIDKGKTRVSRFTWKKCAQQTLKIFEQVANV